MFERISMIAQVLLDIAPCGVGYIGVQSFVAVVRLKGLMASSCNAISLTSIFARWLLLMRLCWQVGNLLMFCCQIVSLLVVPNILIYSIVGIAPRLCWSTCTDGHCAQCPVGHLLQRVRLPLWHG